MGDPGVLVVAETPSLGRAIADLLEAEGINARLLDEQVTGGAFRPWLVTHPVVVVASNGLYCATGRQWVRGEIPTEFLFVVGCRDPLVAAAAGIRSIPLPIRTETFLRVIRGALSELNGARAARHPPARGTEGARERAARTESRPGRGGLPAAIATGRPPPPLAGTDAPSGGPGAVSPD